MSKRMIAAVAATAVAAGLAMTQAASAQEVKVGVILPYTGVGAELAQQIERGAQLYLKLNPDQVKPYTFTMIKRDSKAPNGAEAKIAAQELLTQDKVDVLAGWVYSPDAIASAPVVNAGKKLAVIMNAGTSFITNLSPYYVRTSFTLWHSSYALGEAAAKTLKAKTAVVAYTDYPPGKDSLDGFKTAFEANGGHVIDAIPAGGPGAGARLHAVLPARQGREAGRAVRVRAGRRSRHRGGQDLRCARHGGRRHQADRTRATSSRTSSCKAWATPRSASSPCITTMPTSTIRRTRNSSPPGRKTMAPNSTPDFTAVGGYDGMAAIVHAVQATKGKMDGDAAVKSLLGWKFDSPQGPIMIDPETRDIIMNEYLSEVVKGPDGKLHEKQLAVVHSVKDQCKVLAFGPCAPKK